MKSLPRFAEIFLTFTALLQAWEIKEPAKGHPHKRHECSAAAIDGKFVRLAGRRIQAVDIYDPVTGTWTAASPPPQELHHFQAVTYDGKVVVAGAMTGKYPHETAVERIYFYDPATDV